MKDYFAILEIPNNSNELEIRKAYRRLAKLYHPDVSKSKNAHEKFIEISEAYEFLIHHPYPQNTGYNTTGFNEQDQAFEEFQKHQKKAQDKAQKQARMRYEEFKKQHEAFQSSGINDFALIFKIIVRTLAIVLSLFLTLTPIILTIHNEWTIIFLGLITWPFAGIIAWFVYDNRKHYFIPGELYYTPERIKHIYTDIKETGQKCYYCRYKTANSKPYNLTLLKLKDLKLKTGGFRQHSANYVNENISMLIPRSRKAFITHSVSTLIKILSILSCLVFLDISSIIWRMIIGMFCGGLICSILLLISRTRSHISYIWSYGFVFRAAVWLFFIIQVSTFSTAPFDIKTNDYIYFTVAAILFLDCFLMQLIKLVFGNLASKPIISQFPEVNEKIRKGFEVYNDMTVFSVIYPVMKWIFG